MKLLIQLAEQDNTEADPLVVDTEDDWVEDEEGNFVKKGE